MTHTEIKSLNYVLYTLVSMSNYPSYSYISNQLDNLAIDKEDKKHIMSEYQKITNIQADLINNTKCWIEAILSDHEKK